MWGRVWPGSKGITDLLLPLPRVRLKAAIPQEKAGLGDPSLFSRLSLVPYQNKPDKSYPTRGGLQTPTPKSQKELLNCQSSPCPGPVGFAALSQIEPAPFGGDPPLIPF
ncbi:hypothetical protein JTE90_016555 [Oedothorax gibbosus]|uniref:Uncharacterized protein n=1 Tax=Oedothorax gibbosus TaxID=931172 RepID=A0AAV6TIP6_9ARAC|nr:hypothetical protein JTE90_016555 [Oedothorax gibbosus]